MEDMDEPFFVSGHGVYRGLHPLVSTASPSQPVRPSTRTDKKVLKDSDGEFRGSSQEESDTEVDGSRQGSLSKLSSAVFTEGPRKPVHRSKPKDIEVIKNSDVVVRESFEEQRARKLTRLRQESDNFQEELRFLKKAKDASDDNIRSFLRTISLPRTNPKNDPTTQLLDLASSWRQVLELRDQEIKDWARSREEEEARRTALEKEVVDLKARLHQLESEQAQATPSPDEPQDSAEADDTLDATPLDELLEKHRRQQQNNPRHEEKIQSTIIERLIDEHSAYMSELMAEYEKKLAETRMVHERECESIDRAHRQELRRLHGRIIALESSLAANSEALLSATTPGDLPPATDDSVLAKYKNLKLAIYAVCDLRTGHNSPTNDPELGISSEESRLRLQNLVWETIRHQFFSVSLGFGTFGPTGWKVMLKWLFPAYGKPPSSAPSATRPPPGKELLESFYANMEVNRVRTETFRAFQTTVLPFYAVPRRVWVIRTPVPNTPGDQTDSAGPDAERSAQRVYRNHLYSAYRKISGVLDSAAGAPPLKSRELDAMRGLVEDLVSAASALAFEFGAHPAELKLMPVESGSEVVLGHTWVQYDKETGKQDDCVERVWQPMQVKFGVNPGLRARRAYGLEDSVDAEKWDIFGSEWEVLVPGEVVIAEGLGR